MWDLYLFRICFFCSVLYSRFAVSLSFFFARALHRSLKSDIMHFEWVGISDESWIRRIGPIYTPGGSRTIWRPPARMESEEVDSLARSIQGGLAHLLPLINKSSYVFLTINLHIHICESSFACKTRLVNDTRLYMIFETIQLYKYHENMCKMMSSRFILYLRV